MADAEGESQGGNSTVAWTLIVVGVVAVALALWDLAVEQDGGGGRSIMIAISGLIGVASGVYRRGG